MSMITKAVAKDILRDLRKGDKSFESHPHNCNCSECTESLRKSISRVMEPILKSTGSHRPVCVKCHTELRPERNGVGLLDYADWGPYCIWDSDLWKCPTCGHEIVIGFGKNPISHHFEDGFKDEVNTYHKTSQVIENGK